MTNEDTLAFLKKCSPFQLLEDDVLERMAGRFVETVYPKDTVILKQYGPPSDSVKIVKKGSVKVLMESPESGEVIIDYKGEGDNFGFLSLIGKGRQRTTCIAIADTTCLALDKASVQELLEASPAVSEYFMTYLSRYVDRTYQQVSHQGLKQSQSDQYLFVTPVGSIASKPVTIAEQATIRQAAETMSLNKISSVLVLDAEQNAIGILTDKDLREKVVAQALSVDEPVRKVMARSLVHVESFDSCFDVLIKMLRHNIHHMPVMRNGILLGVVTNHDLMMLQGTSPLALARDILDQNSIGGLAPLAKKTNNIAALLIKENATANQICRIITEINDRLILKVLDLAEQQFGPPPLPYCWILFGSEGRKEQTFKTDQDNALIFSDPVTAAAEAEARLYFATFTAFVIDSLIRIGFPACQAGYMANQPQWCQPLHVWKKYFSEWVHTPNPENVLKFLIFYDFRAIHGKNALAEELREWTTRSLKDNKLFLGHMANQTATITPPIGLFNTFVVERSGVHKDHLDLKVKGITPLLNAVRLFSMEKGVKVTSTIERIQALKETHSIIREYFHELNHAFEFVMLLRIHHQFEQIGKGMPTDNFINPDHLSKLEKRTLKESFNLMNKLQGLIVERYKNFIR